MYAEMYRSCARRVEVSKVERGGLILFEGARHFFKPQTVWHWLCCSHCDMRHLATVSNRIPKQKPNVRVALSFSVDSQNAVTAIAVAPGVPELEAEMSTEIDGELFIVLSALTVGESFDVVMSAGGDRGFESWRKLQRRWDPYTAGRA